MTAHRSLKARLSVLDLAEFFNLAFVHILLQLPSSIFIWQRAPLHQVVDNRLTGRERMGINASNLQFCKGRSKEPCPKLGHIAKG